MIIEEVENFTVYDSEAETVLEVLEDLAAYTNKIPYKDHKGSWQGLDRPTLSEEGMRATVEKLDDTVKEMIAKDTAINVLDYGLKGDGTTEDLTSLKALLSEKLKNVHIIFPSNKTFLLNERIDFLCDNSIIDIQGEIICDTDCINLVDVNESIININLIRKSNNLNLWHDWLNGKYIDYTTFSNYGLRLNNVRNCQINIGRIQGYKNGIYLNPSVYSLNGSSTYSGIQYNIFNLGSIYGNTNCIIFEHGGDSTWANSNTFNVGMLSGGVGVYMKATEYAEVDPYNQNIFYGTGFEYCKIGGILLQIGKDNTFSNFRFDKVDNYYIKTSDSTNRMVFNTNYEVFYEGCELFGEGHILTAPIYKYSNLNTPIAEKQHYLTAYTKVGENLVMKTDCDNSTESYVLSDTEKPFSYAYKYMKDSWGAIRPVGGVQRFNHADGVTVQVTLTNMNDIFYPDTRHANVTYQFTADVEKIYTGHTFKIFTTGNSEGNRIKFLSSAGDEIALPSLAYNKLYYLMNVGSEFKLIEIGSIVS